MLSLEKLLAVAGLLGRSLYGKWLFHRMTEHFARLAVLAVLSIILVIVALAAVLYGVYVALLYWQVPEYYALGGIVAFICIAAVASIAYTVRTFRRMSDLPSQLMHKSRITGYANDVMESFLDGFMAEKKSDHPPHSS